MRNISAALAMVLLGFFVQLVIPQSNAPAESSKKTATLGKTMGGESEKTTPGKDQAVALLCDGLGEAAPCNAAERYTTYLVTVPDPVKSHLGIYFDRWIESVQRATDQAGYTFDSYWMPWRAGAEVEKEERAEREARERTPGVMIFRDSNGERLAFFLVGETPSHGVDRAQMAQFLSYVRDRQITLAGVAGPSFSGTFDSLARMLPPVVDSRSLHIVSGAATRRDAVDQFRETFPLFETTVRDDRDALRELGGFLERSRFNKSELVILSESGTPYGSQFKDVSSIQFPRDISVVRNAYQDDPNLAVGKPAPGTTAASLQTPLKDAQRGNDTPPLFAGAQSAASQEAILLGISRQLRAQRARQVAIVATNVLDVMFLAQFLKRACPDIRLVFLESDVLFVRPPDSQYLEGSLAVSTYPLFLQNQHWLAEEDQPRELMPFANNSTQGVYNAVRVLLGGGKLSEYAQPSSANGYPPVWISVAGRDSFWPLLVYSPEPQAALYRQSGLIAREPSADLPPNDWLMLFGITCGAVGMFAWQSYRARQPGLVETWVADHVLPPLMSPALSEQEVGRAYFHMIVLICLLAMVLIQAAPIVVLLANGERGWYLAIGATTAVMFVWLLWEAVRILYYLVFGPRSWDDRSFALAVLACLFVFVGFGTLTFSPDSRNETLFLALRSLHLDSGVSPTLPIMLAALGLFSWAWVHWQRMIFACERSVLLPQTPYGDLWWQADKIQTYLARPYQLLETPALLSLVVGTAGAFVLLDSFENLWLDVLYRIVIGWIAGLLAVNFQLYLRLWWKLRAMLERMEQLPMRNAFSTLPPDLANASLWSGSPYKRIFLLLTRSAECLDQLANVNAKYVPNLGLTAQSLHYHVDRIVSNETKGYRASLREMASLRPTLASLACQLSAVLQRSHWKRVLPDKPERPAKPTADDLAEEFVVLQYVAFIRYVLLQLRNYMTSFTTGFVLLALSLNSYPFQSTGRIRWTVTGIFLTVGTGVIWTLAQMDRDAILSRLQKTVAGKLDWSFVMKVVSVGILPLLTAMGSQFPEIGRFLTSWVQPAISVLK